MILFQFTPKQLMHFPQPAFLRERRVVEVAWIDSEIRGDVVADHFEPAALLGGELLACAFLLRQPRFEVRVDALGEWDEFVVLVDGEADEGDEVGQDAFRGRAFDLGFIEGGVGLPELGFGPEMRWFLDRVGQFFDVFEPEGLLVGSIIENLEGGDFVFVVLDEFFE